MGAVPQLIVAVGALAALEHWAAIRETTTEGLLSEAIGLEVTYCEALRDGDRLLVERGGRMERLGPGHLAQRREAAL